MSKKWKMNLRYLTHIFASSKLCTKFGFLHFRWNEESSPLRNEITCFALTLDNHRKDISVNLTERDAFWVYYLLRNKKKGPSNFTLSYFAKSWVPKNCTETAGTDFPPEFLLKPLRFSRRDSSTTIAGQIAWPASE